MVYKRILYNLFIIGFLSLLISCQEDTFPANSIMIWVNSFERHCDPPNLDVNCLFVSEEKELDDAVWDILVKEIIGFDHRDGYIYQLRVQKLAAEGALGDSPTEKKYQLIEVLKKEFNESINLNGMWNLVFVDGYTNQDDYVITGKTYMYDSYYRVLYGKYKCNNITFKAKGITKDKVIFNQANATEIECDPTSDNYLPDLEEKVFFNFLQVKNYHIKDAHLHLMDREGKPLLILQKRIFNPKI